MKKRLVGLLLTMTFLLQLLSGCKGSADSFVKQGDMLAEICDAFGMVSYASETAYLSSVPSSNPYFGVVQACIEWDVIPMDNEYDVMAQTTRKALALAVVNAAELAGDGATDDEKLAIAAEYELVETKSNGKIKENAIVDQEEVTNAITLAQALWAGKTYDTPMEEITLKEDVKDYGVDGTNGQIVTDYYTEGNTVYIPISSGIEIQAGDSYVLGNNGSGMTSGVAAEVVTEGDYYVITNREFNDELEELLSVVDELKIQGTYEVDLLNSGTILDGNDNPIQLTYGDNAAAGTLAYTNHASVQPLSNRSSATSGNSQASALSRASAQPLASASGSFKFESGNVEVSGTIKKDSIEFSLKVPVGGSGTSETSIKISNLTPTVDLDIGWTGIHSASAKLDYDIEISEELEWETARSLNGELYYADRELLAGLETEVKNAQGEGVSKTIKVATIPFVNLGIASLDLVIKAKVSISGSIEISLELAGCMGAQYRDGALRFYKDCNTDLDVNLKAKLEVTGILTFAVQALGKEVVGVSAEAGAGGSLKAICHIVDAEGHLLQTQESSGIGSDLADEITDIPILGYVSDIVAAAELAGGVYKTSISLDEEVNFHLDPCVEITAYKILELGLSSESLIAKLLEGKVSFELKIWGANIESAQFFKVHIDDFQFDLGEGGMTAHLGEQCSKTFTPWDAAEEEPEESPEGTAPDENGEGNPMDDMVLDLDSYIMTLTEGEVGRISVTRLPSGYSADALEWVCSDSSVATVSNDGTVTALKEGVATVTVTLKGYPDAKVSCSVTVLSNDSGGEE